LWDKTLSEITQKGLRFSFNSYDQASRIIWVNSYDQASRIIWDKVKKIRTSGEFKAIQRRTLFLGMSDGARMDAFRRKNALHNDQVSISHELNSEKWARMHKALEEGSAGTGDHGPICFENIFLIDDFSGSGTSIKGKLKRFLNDSLGNKAKMRDLSKFCNKDGPNLYIVTYVASEQAFNELKVWVQSLLASAERSHVSSCHVLPPLQILYSDLKVPQQNNNNDELFDRILHNYYDPRIHDEYTGTGGKDVIHGYAGCALPLVLNHNCPNNSIYLLWAQTERVEDLPGLKALFPRVSRHLEGR
jgi:hypothetical protein